VYCCAVSAPLSPRRVIASAFPNIALAKVCLLLHVAIGKEKSYS
jgi:hypothetical protein